MTPAQQLQRVRELRHVLARIGVRQAGGYYARPYQLFASNFLGGAIAGVAASIVAAILLAIDAHRFGSHSTLYHILQAARQIIDAIRARIQGELG